jgi:hypothetical protein
MTEAMPAVPHVVSVHVPKTDRRTPFVVVNVAVGPLVVALGVVMPRSGRLAVRPPLSILGEPAVAAAPEIWAEVEKMAIAAAQADASARHHLTSHRYQRFNANSQ